MQQSKLSQITHAKFLEIIKPSFLAIDEDEDFDAILARTHIILLTDNGVYYRLASTSSKPVDFTHGKINPKISWTSRSTPSTRPASAILPIIVFLRTSSRIWLGRRSFCVVCLPANQSPELPRFCAMLGCLEIGMPGRGSCV